MDKINVCWCSPHPNHYNNYLFEHLGMVPTVNLELVFFKKLIPKYPWTSTFKIGLKTYFLNTKWKIDWWWLFKSVMIDKGKVYVVAGWNEPTMFLLLTGLSLLNRPFILCSDTPKTTHKKNLRNWLRSKWLGFIFFRCRFFLVTGESGVAAAKKIGVSPLKLVNFPFATNIDFFKPSSASVSSGNHFISSGRLDIAHKGYDTAIRALATCKKHRPELQFRYTIAGTGPDEDILRQMVKDLQLEEEVVFVGWLEAADLLEFYQSGNLFIHPSNLDPFPNAVLEAMACGIPVIGSDGAGSVLDRVESGVNGFVFQKGNSDNLAEKIIYFLSMRTHEKEKMGINARLTAEKWSVDYHINVFNEKISACVGF